MFEESASNPSIWASMNSWFTPTVLFVLLNLMIGTIFFSSSSSNPQQQPQQQQHQTQQQQQQQQQQQDEKQEEEQGSNHQNDPQQNPKFGRSPSFLQRVKSINLIKNFRSQEAFLIKQASDSNTIYQEQPSAMETHTRYIFEDTIQHETLNTETQLVLQEIVPVAPRTQTYELDFPKKESHFVSEETQFVSEETHHFDDDDEEEDDDQVPHSLDEVYSKLAKMENHVSRTKSDTIPASGELPAKLPTRIKKSASMKSPFAHFEEADIVETRRPATVKVRGSKVTEADEEVDSKADDFINKFKQQLKLQRMDSILRYKDVIGRGSAK